MYIVEIRMSLIIFSAKGKVDIQIIDKSDTIYMQLDSIGNRLGR